MEQQLAILQGTSPAVQEATAMHFEIVEAAKTAANSLLELGRKLKRMRDSGRYKDLGFESFGAYVEAAAGIRQRQAYNYIQVVETLPAQLIEENAAAGVTKLALLAQLGPREQEELAGDGQLANITVAELKQLIEEKNGMAEQLSLLQGAKEPPSLVAEVQAAEVDLDEIRRQAAEEARRDAWEEAKMQAAKMQERAAAEARLQAEESARTETKRLVDAERKKAAEEKKRLEKELAEAGKKAKESQAAAVEAARKEAFAQGEASAEEAARLAAEEKRAALERAEALQKQLDLASDSETTKFLVLFDQLQETYRQMTVTLGEMERSGKAEKADRLRKALGRALEAMA